TFLGFLKRDSSFNIKVDCETDGKKYNVYLVGNQDEKLIWPTESSSIEPLPIPILTKDMSTGVGILSDYESDDIIIFHGYFGVFVYDLKSKKMILAIDLEKTLGTNQMQGSPYVNVVVNQDGSEMILYLDDTSEEIEQMAYYINTLDGSYSYKKYESFDKSAEYGDSQKYSGDTIESISYTSGAHTYNIFEGWKF
ncbi:MAG: hypothetical protein RR525_09500, partial [Cellulosilyticaceae bacterium]